MQRYSTFRTVMMQPVSTLGYALLGLIQQKPRSGYDLRKTFTETPMGSFSNSPGAIYPALARLEKRGSIASEVKDSAGLRRRRVYRITAAGERELKDWLSQPITRDEIIRGMGEVMLRFAFMEQALGGEASITFLGKLRVELNAYVPGLKQYLEGNASQMPLSGMLALDSGIRHYDALQQWVEYAIQTYEAVVTDKAKSSDKFRESNGGKS
jgi:DNA-binding PadR family transcriptional regulator